ncbi:MAG: aspartate kinase [Lachnospiraceae bacterium]|nr:aspartate kinase [Lachnospiraceae bacterium]
MKKVMKFGGSSVKDAIRIKRVAKRILKEKKKGEEIVVVLSAMGDTTDDLIALAKEISDSPSKREMDMLLTTGEQVSSSLLAMALSDLGVNAISLNAFQARIKTNSVYGNAKIKNIDSERIQNELDAGRVAVVTGFQGINKNEDMLTLGRGGSDTTAVAIAAAIGADICEIYTDVDGIYTGDPRIIENARRLDYISYDGMLEMATLGAKVLHNRSVEMAKRYNVTLVVKSSLEEGDGTRVLEGKAVEGLLIDGVTVDDDVARLAVIGLLNEPGMAFKIFNELSKADINVDMILQSVGRDGKKDITFTVSIDDAKEAYNIINGLKERFGFEDVSLDEKVSKVSLIGAGIQSNFNVATKMFEALYNVGVNIQMISTSEIRITVLVDEEESARGAKAVHDVFLND